MKVGQEYSNITDVVASNRNPSQTYQAFGSRNTRTESGRFDLFIYLVEPPPASKIDVSLSSNGWDIDFGDLVLETEVGRGNFGSVYKGKWRGNENSLKTR